MICHCFDPGGGILTPQKFKRHKAYIIWWQFWTVVLDHKNFPVFSDVSNTQQLAGSRWEGENQVGPLVTESWRFNRDKSWFSFWTNRMTHLYPMKNPWDRYIQLLIRIYISSWFLWCPAANGSGRYTSPMDPMGDGMGWKLPIWWRSSLDEAPGNPLKEPITSSWGNSGSTFWDILVVKIHWNWIWLIIPSASRNYYKL